MPQIELVDAFFVVIKANPDLVRKFRDWLREKGIESMTCVYLYRSGESYAAYFDAVHTSEIKQWFAEQ